MYKSTGIYSDKPRKRGDAGNALISLFLIVFGMAIGSAFTVFICYLAWAQ